MIKRKERCYLIKADFIDVETGETFKRVQFLRYADFRINCRRPSAKHVEAIAAEIEKTCQIDYAGEYDVILSIKRVPNYNLAVTDDEETGEPSDPFEDLGG